MRKPFYGWVIVGVSFLIGITEAGVFQNILSIFMKPMVNDYGWSRASVAGAMAFGSVGGGMLSLVIGPILDRHGPRMAAFWGILFLSMGLCAMAFANHIWQLYIFFGMGRMIAIGVLSLAISVSISNWFLRQRGRAMGITRIGDRFGSTLLPLMVQFLILWMGWRVAWGILGAVVFFMSGIPSLLFLRRRPEDMGLLPDGASPDTENTSPDVSLNKEVGGNASLKDLDPVWSRSEAIHTRAFWMLTLFYSLIPFLQAGINFHIYPFLTDQGFSEMTGVLILTTISVSGMAGSALWGMLTERFRIQTLLTANVFINGLVFLLLYLVVIYKLHAVIGTGIVFFLAALFGACLGGRNPMMTLAWAQFFGRRSLGSIISMANPFNTTANAIGPVFAALCYDLLSSYAFPFYLFVIVFFISGVVSKYMRPPAPPSRDMVI